MKYLTIFLLGCTIQFGGSKIIQFLLSPSPQIVSREATLAPDHIKKAMLKMGPNYQYRIWFDGQLQVKVNNKWMKLGTEKEEKPK